MRTVDWFAWKGKDSAQVRAIPADGATEKFLGRPIHVLLDCGRVACACRAAACSDSLRLRGWVRGRLHRQELASHSMTFGTGPVAKMSDVGRAEYRIRAPLYRAGRSATAGRRPGRHVIRASCSSSAQQVGARRKLRRRDDGVGRTRLPEGLVARGRCRSSASAARTIERRDLRTGVRRGDRCGWWLGAESNRRPQHYECRALTV